MAESRKSDNDALQGLFGLVGISLGLIPLIRVVLDGQVGMLLAWVPGTDQHPGDWLIPSGVLVVCLVVIGLLETAKKR